MIPYYQPPNLHLGPLTIEPFGIFAAAGIYLAAHLIARRGAREGHDPQLLLDYSVWGVLGGIVMGHLVHLLLYHPEELEKSPLQILKVWDGLSSFGGLLGGILAAAVFFRMRGRRFHEFADAFALGLAPGWGVARLGCFAVHDHMGVRTDFPLAVAFPGGPRHDLGLYDALLLFAIAALLYRLASANVLKGRLLAVLALVYGPVRFLFDFLRATDVAYSDKRYAGLTPAQYGCVLVVGYGLYRLLAPAAPSPARPASAP